MLKETLGNKRIQLADDQRRRLAVKGKVLGRKVLEQQIEFSDYVDTRTWELGSNVGNNS